uniref:Nephrocystin 3-like N-terminal domain-containing protein n=1 Tax=Oryzias latipes TaxID=8090 RepID=A0A3P9L417_ORYLA
MHTEGKDGFPGPFSSSCVKIYLCSNPEDSRTERQALREDVFPRFRRYCRRSLGLDVRVIDPFESSDPRRWPDENTRQRLITECRESSAGPYLLALVGHQYGASCLPTQVEVSEFQLLLQESQRAGISTLELEKAYQRDENIIPASFCRRSSSSPLESDGKEETEKKRKHEELRKMLQAAVTLSVCRGLLSPERARSFYTSVLDKDLRFALANPTVEDVTNRCVVYVHKVLNARKDMSKQLLTDLELNLQAEISDPTHDQFLSDMCDDYLPALVTSCHLLVYTFTTECDRCHGYTTARRRAYADSLSQQVYADLVSLIGRSNLSGSGGVIQNVGSLKEERAEQVHLCSILSGFYDIIQPQEEKVRAYVQQKDQHCPLVVVGGPCTGKKVLLAHCAHQLKSWLTDADPVGLSYFCSMSVDASPERLLTSLCLQITAEYDHQFPADTDTSFCPNPTVTSFRYPRRSSLGLMNLSELQKHLASLLTLLPCTKRPLILLLDGLDQLENSVGVQIVRNLPSPLPCGVKLIITVSSNQPHLLNTIKQQYSHVGGLPHHVSEEESGFLCVEMGSADTKQCRKMLTFLLRGSGRRVTSGQQALINEALTSCRLPLYTRLLHVHAAGWSSDSEVNESFLPDGVHSSISALLDHLELKHGSALVARATSFLTLSKSGLSEAELADLLSNASLAEEEEEDSVFRPKVTQVDTEKLLLDFWSFLLKRSVGGTQVLFWVSRHFGLVVSKKYLDVAVKKKIHSEMADYFSGWRVGGRGLNKDDQPFLFGSPANESWVNVRKIIELPHHLQQSGRWAELEAELLMSFSFHQAMLQAGRLGDLISMLESDRSSSSFNFLRERRLLANMLRSSACLLQRSPPQLPTVMETNLLPFWGGFPTLGGYIRDIREEKWQRGRGLDILLWPCLHSVPALQGVDDRAHETRVTESAATRCGTVAQTMEDGFAWIWRSSRFVRLRMSLSCEQQEVKFTGVRSSGRFLLLSAEGSRLFVWDVTGSKELKEVEDPLRSGGASKRVGGFIAHQEKLCWWWENENFVCVFDVCGRIVAHFQCRSAVTYVAFSTHSFHVFCGQKDGTMSAFDIQTGTLLGSCSHWKRSAIMLMIFREEQQEMACLARTGNIALWDVAAKEQTFRLVREKNSHNESDILNTDYVEDISLLLVCGAKQVTLWGSDSWELLEKFSAPKTRVFTQAMLSQDGHLFSAVLRNCSLVLVWKISSGQCVLSLETNRPPLLLLRTLSETICVSQSGGLTIWDSGMIDAAGTTPKMRYGVKKVVAEKTGKCFYTSDGSRVVWRWSLDPGHPRDSFLHDGAVEKLQLSPNSLKLVSLSAGEIYVWDTESGQNRVRIGGSRATDLLITPNSNFGVSISEQGLSHVWKVAHGSIVCSIHLHLSDAQVLPDGTFLIGLHRGDLLAASLWSGLISKRFSCMEPSEVVAFHTLTEHPDFVVVMAALGAVYTWKVSEETVCQHFELPPMFYCDPGDFQMSSDGSFALLSTCGDQINLLDLSRVRLCSFKAEGIVIKACLDQTGSYVAYMSSLRSLEESCSCHLHNRPVLTVTRLSDGEQMGSVHLSENPSALLVCDQKRVFVGFEDGSVGLYSILDSTNDEEALLRGTEDSKGHWKENFCPFEDPLCWFPQAKPNVNWPQIV